MGQNDVGARLRIMMRSSFVDNVLKAKIRVDDSSEASNSIRTLLPQSAHNGFTVPPKT